MEIFVDSLYDAIIDSLKVLPILFLAYLLVSFISHDHSHKFSKILSRNSKTGVLFGAFLGCVPQCGFSSVISDLYSAKKVSLGTLIAVFVATSDEAIPVLLSTPDKIVDLLILVGLKVLFAIFWGYLIDGVILLCHRQKKNVENVEQVPQHHHDHHHECGHIHSEFCEDECGHEHGDCCVNNVFLDAFLHTFSIAVYIFVATFVLNIILNYCGTEALKMLFTTNGYIQILVASLVGLIPNCASSVLLVELYVFGTISFPALLAGLTAGAGVGLFVLWSTNKKRPAQNLGIMILQYLIGVASGMIMTLVFR